LHCLFKSQLAQKPYIITTTVHGLAHEKLLHGLNLARESTRPPDFKQRVNEGTSTRSLINRIPDVLFPHEAKSEGYKNKNKKKKKILVTPIHDCSPNGSSPCLINRILFNLENRDYKITNTNKKLSAKKLIQHSSSVFPKMTAGGMLCLWLRFNRCDSRCTLWFHTFCQHSLECLVKLCRERTRYMPWDMLRNGSIILYNFAFMVIRNTPRIPLCSRNKIMSVVKGILMQMKV
jgi:hypothetical protein